MLFSLINKHRHYVIDAVIWCVPTVHGPCPNFSLPSQSEMHNSPYLAGINADPKVMDMAKVMMMMILLLFLSPQSISFFLESPSPLYKKLHFLLPNSSHFPPYYLHLEVAT